MHLNSHGERAISDTVPDANNQFLNYIKAPIRGVNKIGLLYATIPKMWDTIHSKNNRFEVAVEFDAIGTVTRNVIMPLVNYYPGFIGRDCVVDDGLVEVMNAGVRAKGTPQDAASANRVNFNEALMWAINRAFRGAPDPLNAALFPNETNIRCIVYLINGRITIIFGRLAGALVPALQGEIRNVAFNFWQRRL